MKRKDFAIGELPAAETMDTESLFAVEQEGLSKQVSGELLSGFIEEVSDKANQVSMSGGATLIVQGITGENHIIEIKDDGLSGGGSSVEMVEQATPVITIDENTGYVTAQATQQYGIVNGGTKTATKKITAATLIPENIKNGVNVLGVTGNYISSGSSLGNQRTVKIINKTKEENYILIFSPTANPNYCVSTYYAYNEEFTFSINADVLWIPIIITSPNLTEYEKLCISKPINTDDVYPVELTAMYKDLLLFFIKNSCTVEVAIERINE